MEKKRSIGIIVISIIIFLSPFVITLLFNIALLISTTEVSLWRWNKFIQSCLNTYLFQNYWFAFLLFGILGLGIIKLNNKFRLITIAITTAMAVGGPLGLVVAIFITGSKIHVEIIKKYGVLIIMFPSLIIISASLLYALIAFYLTRPKIKEQFK